MSFLKMEFGVRLKSGWLFFMSWTKLYTTSLLTLTKEQSQVLRMERRSERKTKVRRLLVKTSSSPFSFLSFFLPPLQSGSPRFHPHPLHSPPLAPGIFYEKESAELQVGAFPNILFKWRASRPIRSRPLGSSPDKLCGLAPEPQPLFFVWWWWWCRSSSSRSSDMSWPWIASFSRLRSMRESLKGRFSWIFFLFFFFSNKASDAWMLMRLADCAVLAGVGTR